MRQIGVTFGEILEDGWRHLVATGICTPQFAKAIFYPSLVLAFIVALEIWLSPLLGAGRGLGYAFFIPLWLAARMGGRIAGMIIVTISAITLTATSHGSVSPIAWAIHLTAMYAILRLFTLTEKDYSAARHAALSDPLTGVMNRRAFKAKVPTLIRETLKSKSAACLLLIDCDKFKLINDVYGHAMGDQALIAVAKSLRDCVQDGDLVGRLGGDEFVVYLNECDRIGANVYAAKVRRALAGISNILPFELNISVGIAFVGEDGIIVDHLLSIADDKMFRQKRMNRDMQMTFAEIGFEGEPLKRAGNGTLR
ncbi:GGDEF domain-containing protein [Kamptonema cortianum]|nr:GGDEF domain-containing protein [Kamptonema cortianum]